MKTSPARRVYDILKRAESVHPSKAGSINVAWAVIFGLANADSPPSPNKVDDNAVTTLLSELRSEIKHVQDILSDDQEASEVAKPAIKRAMNFTSMQHLAGPWQDHRPAHLTSETLTAWAWMALYCPDEDIEGTPEDLERLQKEIDELEDAAKQLGVPASLRAFTLRQVASLRNALRRYSISGLEPLSTALDQGIGEMLRKQDELSEKTTASPAQSKGVLAKLGGVWSSVAKVAGQIAQLQKAYEALRGPMAQAITYLEHFKN